MLEKLKTAFRVFFPKKLSPREVFENELINNSLKAELMDNGNSFKVSINDNCRVIVRNWKHSDLLVFKQVFLNDEYKNVLDLFDLNNLGNTNKRIIDAGANVGYSTVLFDRFFRNSTIACIEPSPSNFDVLKSNVSGCKNSIILYNNALTGQAGLTFSIQKDFRDGLDWAHSTVQDKHGEIKGKTILEIVNENNFERIDLLKIDIEGAECFLFEEGADLSFLSITDLIVIEIHDEFNIREWIHGILREYQFILLEFGEMTYCIKKQL